MQKTLQDLIATLKSPIPLLSWLLATFTCAIAGPFGTYETDPFTMRLLFWGGILLVATVYSLFCLNAARNFRPQWNFFEAAMVSGLVFTITYSLFIILLIRKVYVGQPLPSSLLIVSLVACITAVITKIMHYQGARLQLVKTQSIQSITPVPRLNQSITNSNPFLDRINADMGSKLIRLQMRDHYVEAYTCRGMQLIHIRFSDAVAALSDYNGIQVHRSHWVNLDEVDHTWKKDGKACFYMSDGSDVPVARSKIKELKEMGLL